MFFHLRETMTMTVLIKETFKWGWHIVSEFWPIIIMVWSIMAVRHDAIEVAEISTSRSLGNKNKNIDIDPSLRVWNFNPQWKFSSASPYLLL